MATVARPSRASSEGEARVSCPACGQPIHPVAGRCKHCKTDLVKLREAHGARAPRVDPGVLSAAAGARPATPSPFGAAPAASPFAPLAAPAPPVSPYAPPVSPYAPPVSPYAPPVSPYAPPTVLPGGASARTNGHANAPRVDATPLPAPTPYPGLAEAAVAAQSERGGLARRWPIVVAILAGIAIVVCVLLLALDGGNTAGASERPKARPAAGMPAPDRMDTNPVPPRPDPWGPQGTAPTTPDPPPSSPPVTIPDLKDPFADPTPPPPTPGRAPGGVPPAEEFTGAWLDALCSTLQRCGFDDDMLDAMCQQFRDADITGFNDQMVRAGRCRYDEDDARACIAAIDGMKCDLASFDMNAILGLADVQRCFTALQCQ